MRDTPTARPAGGWAAAAAPGQAPGLDGREQLPIQLFGQILAAIDDDVQFHGASRGGQTAPRLPATVGRAYGQGGLGIKRHFGYRAQAGAVLSWRPSSLPIEAAPMQPRLDYYTASPQALKGMMVLEATLFELAIDRPLLDLIRIRVSQLNHCGFCSDMHAMAALARGESTRRLLALCVWRDSPLFTRREQLALAWSEATALLACRRAGCAVRRRPCRVRRAGPGGPDHGGYDHQRLEPPGRRLWPVAARISPPG